MTYAKKEDSPEFTPMSFQDLIFRQLERINKAQNPMVKYEELKDLEGLISPYTDDAYKKDLETIKANKQATERDLERKGTTKGVISWNLLYGSCHDLYKALSSQLNRLGLLSERRRRMED